MRRALLDTIDAPVDVVRDALVAETGLPSDGSGRVAGPFDAVPIRGTDLEAVLAPAEPHGTKLVLSARGRYHVPFFGWFVAWQARAAAGTELRHLADRVRARATGTPPPPRPRRWPIVPPVPFTTEQASRLAALAAVAVLANFNGALLTQNGDAVIRTFDREDEALGFALAIARAGVLISLVVVALADRFGRRRLILLALAGGCAANAVAAAAPTFEVFTGAQLLTRAFVNACLVVAGIAAVEEAPDGARAFAAAMFALALGAGVALSVVFLPLADLGGYGWRVSFAASAAAIVLLPVVARSLSETRRYAVVVERAVRRGRIGGVVRNVYGARFAVLAALAFVTNLFVAPSSQLTNRYLTETHDFSNTAVAAFRTVTLGLPGLLGILLGGRLAETRGRRPVTVAGLLVATAAQMGFFLASGDALLWIAPTIAVIAAASAGLALGTLDAELFPTEVRGTSNGFLLVAGVAGSAAGLVLATQLRAVVGGLGPGIALCGIPTLFAAVLLVPRLPETVHRRLDDVSPTGEPGRAS